MEESKTMKSEQIDENEIKNSNLKNNSTKTSSTSVTEGNERILDLSNDDSLVIDFSDSENESKLSSRTSCQGASDHVTESDLESELLKIDDKDDFNDYTITNEDDILLLSETLLPTNPSDTNHQQINRSNISAVSTNCIAEVINTTDEIKESTYTIYSTDGHYKTNMDYEIKINANDDYVLEDTEILEDNTEGNMNFNCIPEEKEFFADDDQSKTNEVPVTDSGKLFCSDEQILGNSEGFYSKSSFEPTKISNTSTSYDLCQSSPNNSTDLQIDNSICNEGLKMKENTVSDIITGEILIPEVINSSIDRRGRIDLLKEKTTSLFASYNKYRNEFSQISLKNLNKQVLGSPKSLKNLPPKSLQKPDAESVDEKTDSISAYEHSPIITSVKKAKEEPHKSPITTHIKKCIENDTKQQFTLKANEEALENKKSDITMEGQAVNSFGEIVPYVSEKSIYKKLLSPPEEARKDKILENICMEQHQDVSIKNRYNSEDCEKRNEIFSNNSQISGSRNDTKEVLNEKDRQTQGSKYTDILNSVLYVEHEIGDCQEIQMDTKTVLCSRCNKPITDMDDSHAFESERTEECITQNYTTRSKMNSSLEVLLELFSVDNTVSQNILLALSSEQFKRGACLTNIIKYLRQEVGLKNVVKLKQDVSNFLKAAVTARIIKLKNKRYSLTEGSLLCDQTEQTADIGNKLTNTEKTSEPECLQRKMTLRETTQRKMILKKIEDGKM